MVKRLSAKVKCPDCRKAHIWSRREAIAYSEGKSVRLICINCGCVYWCMKSGINIVMTKETKNELEETVSEQ